MSMQRVWLGLVTISITALALALAGSPASAALRNASDTSDTAARAAGAPRHYGA